MNQYAYVEDVAGDAGITGVATDPFDWGVPQLSFSTFERARRDAVAAHRPAAVASATRWTRPIGRKHTLRLGGDVRLDESDNQTDANARGAFVFTGLYASGGRSTVRGGGARLRRLPARAAAAGDGAVRARQRPHVGQVAERRSGRTTGARARR